MSAKCVERAVPTRQAHPATEPEGIPVRDGGDDLAEEHDGDIGEREVVWLRRVRLRIL